MPLQRKQYSELFCLFSELHKIVGAEYEQARYITCFISCWVPQHHPPPRDKKVLKDTLDLGEFMRWVVCCFYMDFWVGIPERSDWWSVTPSVIHIVTPFF